MSRLFILAAAAALTLTNLPATRAQAAQDAPRAAQQHLIGEITALDAAGRLTVKSDAGATVEVSTDEKTAFRRIPPGQTSLDRAEPVARADLRVGDRVLVPNGASGGTAAARQVIIMARAALAAQREREREERRRRTLAGRVTAVDAARKEITVQARGREGVQAVTVAANDATRFLRFAPDSLRLEHARPGSLADVRVGDQFRATGDRDAAGARFTAEEVITGSVARVFGQIVSVDAARGEITVKNESMGETFTVALGQHTTLRRVTPEVAERLRQQRAERGQRRERRAGAEGSAGERAEAGRGRADGEAREGRSQEGRGRRRGEGRGPGAGGGNFMQMFENLPAITAAELKKGDSVVITGTSGADASRLTAVSLVTGDAELLRLFQRGPGGGRNMSPGLPGEVMGGGTGGSRDQP